MTVIVCGMADPVELIRRPSGEPRWCFHCRKVQPFVFTLTGDAESSYYDPSPAVRCEAGHFDGDLFPGRNRIWDED